MAYDEGLAQRIRDATDELRQIEERKMFGGLAFLVRGHMAFGIVGDELMVRVGPDAYGACVTLPHARPMTFTGKPLKTMVYVAPEGFASDDALRTWLDRGLAFNATQPAKSKPAKSKPASAEKKKAARARRRG